RGGSTTVDVPVDDALEKTALQYIRSEERWRRTEGAIALKHFKSDENVARLKPLLSDDDPYISEHAENNLGIEVRIHTVRKAAFETLTYWGIEVAKPVFEEKVTRLDAVRSVDLIGKNFTPAALKDLARFKNLQTLNLEYSRLTDEDVKELARYRNLKGLNL